MKFTVCLPNHLHPLRVTNMQLALSLERIFHCWAHVLLVSPPGLNKLHQRCHNSSSSGCAKNTKVPQSVIVNMHPPSGKQTVRVYNAQVSVTYNYRSPSESSCFKRPGKTVEKQNLWPFHIQPSSADCSQGL